MNIFNIDNLSCGIAVFSLSFVMLSAAILVSKDRTGAFLTRMYSSPMRPVDFIIGYTLPLMVVALAQMIVTFVASVVIAVIISSPLNIGGVVLAYLALVPSAVFFVSIGVAIGFCFNQNASPPLCSFIISAAGLLGGIWFNCEDVGGVLELICKVLPFFNAVASARLAMQLDGGALVYLVIISAYAIAFFGCAILAFKVSRKR